MTKESVYTIYDIVSIIMSICSIFYFIIAIYYGIKILWYTKFKNTFDWMVLMITSVSGFWVIAFSYIHISTLNELSPIAPIFSNSLFIGPIILLTAVSIAILLKIIYIGETNGGFKWLQIPKT